MSIVFRKDRGKWIASRTVGKKRFRVSCETKREAKQIDEELRRKQLECMGLELDYPLSEAFASYLATDSAQKTKGSQKADFRFFNLAADFFSSLKINKLSDVTLESLQLFQLHMANEFKWSSTTISKQSVLLRSVFNKALATGKLSKDPCQFWKVPRGTSQKRRPMTLAEFNTIMGQSMPDWLRPVLLFIRLTGARGASVASLEWADVHFPSKRLYLSSRKGGIGKIKRIPFPMYSALLEFMLKLVPDNNPGAKYVFLDDEQRPLTGHRISDSCHRLIKASGLKGVVLYSLRHALAVDLTENGVSIEIVRQLMGHSSISQTQTYAQGVSADSLGNSMNSIRSQETPIAEAPQATMTKPVTEQE